MLQALLNVMAKGFLPNALKTRPNSSVFVSQIIQIVNTMFFGLYLDIMRKEKDHNLGESYYWNKKYYYG
ncbi:hypothetical protein V2J09_000138 [Rumex salicifolius]